MPGQRNNVSPCDDARLQRALVLQLLRYKRQPTWTYAELRSELVEAVPSAFGAAIESLVSNGVACSDGERLWATQPVRHLSELELIAI